MLLNDKEQTRKQWEAALKIDSSLDDLRVRLKALPTATKGTTP